MLADFRFVLGAILAVAMLAVAGLGMVTSVALMREAHIAPIEDLRSLAYAGPVTRNEFYDPDAALRFEDAGAKDPPPVPTEARTVSLSANPPPEIVEDRETDPPHAAEAPPPSPPAAMEAVAPPIERVASAPATPPAAFSSEPGPMIEGPPPQAAGVPAAESQPVPPPRPKPQFRRRVARAHIRRAVAARPQPPQNSPFTSQWPPFGTQFGAQFGATTAWKKNPFGGPFENRPQ